MVKRLQFYDLDKDFHPFTSSSPLKITFHTETLTGLTGDEAIAVELLQGFSQLPHIEAIQTEPGNFPHMEIGQFDSVMRLFPLTLVSESKTVLVTGVSFPYNSDRLVEQFVKTDGSNLNRESLVQDVVIAQAHYSLGQHILVTMSPNLLEHRDDNLIERCNPRTPSEAAKIVGLYLRSRGITTIPIGQMQAQLPRWLFYWALTRHRLPDMWAYFGACVDAGSVRSDDTSELGGSILTRCSRVLRTRDEIGLQFYARQNNDTREEIMYHLDYLNLLLVGAFDAQARVAHRAYRIVKPKDEEYVNFRRKEFVDELKKSNAVKLCSVLSGQAFVSIKTLLFDLRHTIHSAGLKPIAVGTANESENDMSLVIVPDRHVNDVWQAAQQLHTPEYWGLVNYHSRLMFEPYTYASALIYECFKLINQIAEATDITGLFTSGNVPPLRSKPSNNEIWSDWMGKRLMLLG